MLGALVLAELVRMQGGGADVAGAGTLLVLPLVLAAAAADFGDGRIARRLGTQSGTGRLVDNLCDVVFLAFSFTGFAIAQIWSLPIFGSATRYWEHANWLPVIALGLSFGSYMLRWAIFTRLGEPMRPSARGHSAGVANYVLAVVGGVAVLPGVTVTPWLLEPAFVTVALLNVSGASENFGLIVERLVARRR